MEMQQLSYQSRGSDAPSADGSSGVAEALAACSKLADAADAAIDRALSGEAERFLQANQQSGGE